jgi:hypothetical protein
VPPPRLRYRYPNMTFDTIDKSVAGMKGSPKAAAASS